MLQVTFKNLLPSGELVSAANDAYLTLRDRKEIGSRRLRCNVTISAEQRSVEPHEWVCVQVEVLRESGRPLRVVAEGVDAPRVVRSGLLAAVPVGMELSRVPSQAAVC